MPQPLLVILGVLLVSGAFPLFVNLDWLDIMPKEQLFTLFASLAAVILGFFLRGFADSKREKRAARSYSDALSMEIDRCGDLAATYLHDNVAAPLYRLPTDAYHRALPRLLQAGMISGAEADVLQDFYLQAEQINRGLDNLEEITRHNLTHNEVFGLLEQDDVERLRIKTTDLRSAKYTDEASDRYLSARRVCDAIVQRTS